MDRGLLPLGTGAVIVQRDARRTADDRPRRSGGAIIADVIEKALLVTSTNEPYQPVRLTFAIPSTAVARKALSKLRCVTDDRQGGMLTVWLTDEARELLGAPEKKFELLGQRVIIGVFRVQGRTLVLQVRSHARAKGIAKLARKAIGPGLQLVRCRVVNRLFAAEEQTGEVGELDRWLDRDVVVIDPEVTAKEAEAEFAEIGRAIAGRSDRMQALEEELAKRRRDPGRPRTDVPLVEDAPMCPEDENETMDDLSRWLDFRFVRAVRRWQGDDVTLREVIEEAADAAAASGVLGPR